MTRKFAVRSLFALLILAACMGMAALACAQGESGAIGYSGDYRDLVITLRDGGTQNTGKTMIYDISGEIYQEGLADNPLFNGWHSADKRVWTAWDGADSSVINLYTGEVYHRNQPQKALSGYSSEMQAAWVTYDRVWADLYLLSDENFKLNLFSVDYKDTVSASFSQEGRIPHLSPGTYEIRLMVAYTFGEEQVYSRSFTVEKGRAKSKTPAPARATPTPKKTVKATPTPVRVVQAPVAPVQPEPEYTPVPAAKPTPTPAPQWSAWSGWSTSAVSASATREVETREEQVVTTTTQYSYSRWRYFNTDPQYNQYMCSYSQYEGPSYKPGSGKWEYKTTTSPLDKVKVISGHQQYSGNWYNEKVSTNEEITYTTYYRYRDRIN